MKLELLPDQTQCYICAGPSKTELNSVPICVECTISHLEYDVNREDGELTKRKRVNELIRD